MRPRLRSALLAVVAGLGVLLCAAPPAAEARTREPTLGEIAAVDLPREGREVLSKIHVGGGFRYERDGVVFGNREGQLPKRSSGFYHEYTVPTPGARDRGARRIVCGGPLSSPVVCYYTSDHYRTFRRIRE